MNSRILAFREDLTKGLLHFEHQAMYPDITGDYFEKATLRYNTDPLLRARVQTLEAGVLHLLDKHGFLAAIEREDGEKA